MDGLQQDRKLTSFCMTYNSCMHCMQSTLSRGIPQSRSLTLLETLASVELQIAGGEAMAPSSCAFIDNSPKHPCQIACQWHRELTLLKGSAYAEFWVAGSKANYSLSFA